MVGDAVTRSPPARGMLLKFVEQIEAREAARIVASASEPLDFSDECNLVLFNELYSRYAFCIHPFFEIFMFATYRVRLR
jgi:hypothetical protein